RAASHLKSSSGNGNHSVVGDAVSLPFANESFDLVSCCLFVHHLEPEVVVRFINESLRVSRAAVIINDIVRNPVHLALAYASFPLYRSPLTHHDAPASIQRAYTIAEMQGMLRKTAAARSIIRPHPL